MNSQYWIQSSRAYSCTLRWLQVLQHFSDCLYLPSSDGVGLWSVGLYEPLCTAVSLDRLLNFLTMKFQVTYNKYAVLQVPTIKEYSLDGESYRFHNKGINHSFTASSGNVLIVLKFRGLYINAITFLCKFCIILYILNSPLFLGAYWSCWVGHRWWIKGEAANKG